MQVETYEIDLTEGTASGPEAVKMEAEAVALCETLGLAGQLNLITPPDPVTPDIEPGTRLPYRKATEEEVFVLNMVCPATTPIEQYDADPIPLRVLQVAAHARETGQFLEIVVRHRRSPNIKDPFLVGRRKPMNSNWSGAREDYLLARWAEHLDAWPTVVQQAMSAWGDKVKAKVAGIRGELALCEARLAHPCDIDIGTAMAHADGPSFYGL